MLSACLVVAVAVAVAAALASQLLAPRDLGLSYEVRSARPHPTKTMGAAAYAEHGDPSVLVFDPAYPRPVPRGDQVLVRVVAAAANPCDFKFRRNKTPWPLSVKPKIPGEDVAGLVVQAPKGSRFRPGDRVAAMLDILGSRWGATAELVAVPEAYLATIPEALSFEEAAAVPLVALTTVQAFDKVDGGLRGKKVLIHAGAGGVGSFAIQYARSQGAAEIATTCSAAKADFVRRLGADVVIDYRNTKFEDVVENYDVVLDTMGFMYEGRTLNAGRSVLGPQGHYFNLLSSDWALGSDGQEATAANARMLGNLLSFKLKRLVGLSGQNYDAVAVVPDGAQLQAVLDSMSRGEVRAVIDQTFPLLEAADAHRYLETGRATGKVMISMA